MQSRVRAGDGPTSGSHPTVVDIKSREPDPTATTSAGWLNQLLGRPKPQGRSDSNPLLAFSSETAAAHAGSEPIVRPSPAPIAGPRLGQSKLFFGLAALVVAGGLAAFAAIRLNLIRMPTFTAADGRLVVDTKPSGAQVLIDGETRGTTPLTLTVRPGAHTMTVRNGGDERVVPLSVASGAELSQYFEFQLPEPVLLAGRMSIVTEPASARVTVDGRAVGTSPIATLDVGAGPHRVVVSSETGSAERTVTVEPGTTTSVVFSLPKTAAPLGGWLSVTAPFDVQILEGSDIIASGGTTKIMMEGGRHDIVLVNRTLDYQEARKVDVTPGKVTPIRIDPPRAMLSANARPWADVFVDGAAVGQTPIANFAVAIGTHQVVFRHPQFGERRETVVVGTKGPNRVSVDLTK